MLKKLLHRLGWHQMVAVGWSVMGNQIEKCLLCDRYTYTVGSIDPLRVEIDKEQANSLLGGEEL
jgi:hypothetical protein